MNSRAVGVGLVVLGAICLAGPCLLLLWMHRMYTTGLSAGGGVAEVVGLALIGAAAVLRGVLMLRRSAAA